MSFDELSNPCILISRKEMTTMKRSLVLLVILSSLLILDRDSSRAQTHWIVGGNMGMSITSGGGGSSTDFTFGPMAEVLFNKHIAIGSEFDITTATGTPITWANYFKYYFAIPGSGIRPYADAGFALVFATGGPYVFIPFGGGSMFPVAKNLYINADLTLGPEFFNPSGFSGAGITLFIISIRAGIRYEIP
jgi:hypothetical protein